MGVLIHGIIKCIAVFYMVLNILIISLIVTTISMIISNISMIISNISIIISKACIIIHGSAPLKKTRNPRHANHVLKTPL